MKRAGVGVGPVVTGIWKDVVLLLTWPVGPTAPLPPGGIGIVPLVPTGMTFVGTKLLLIEYKVVVLLPWFETQMGLVELEEIPHGFTKAVS